MADILELFERLHEKYGKKEIRPVSHIVAGLGNPGDKYTFSRHNAGFLAIDFICRKYGLKCNRINFGALTCEAELGGVRTLILKPQNFMNNSGEAVGAAAAFYKIPPENVIVISDDISLDIGRMRIRRGGSAGGHNGLKSIISHMKSEAFPRIKLGVGKVPAENYDTVDWVLGRIPAECEKPFFEILKCVPDALELMLCGKTEEAMCAFNGISGQTPQE